MLSRKRRRSSSEVVGLKDGKQQKIDKFISNTQIEATCFTNRYAVLDSETSILPGEEERNAPLETSPLLHCCQQLPAMLMELFSKEAILTSRSMAMLLDKIKDIDLKVNTLKEDFNNFVTMPGLIRDRDKRDAEPIRINKTADGDLLPAEEVSGKHLEFNSLILQKNCLAVSFNSQTDFHRWRNFKMITLSLSQLLNCSYSEVLLRSYHRLPRFGAFSRIVLQFKNDNIPARMMSLQNLFYYKFGIWVTRVFKNNTCVPLCPKTLLFRKPNEGLGDTSGNKMLSSSRVLKPDSQICHTNQAKNPRMAPKPLRLDFDHKKKVTQVDTQGHPLPENDVYNDVYNPDVRSQDKTLEVDVSYGRKPIFCQKGVALETDLDLRSHQVISTIPGSPSNKKSLAIELLEAEQALVHRSSLPPSDEIHMEVVETAVQPSIIVPVAQQGAERAPASPPQPRGNLENSIEDTLFLTFGDLSPQEQHDVIERLEYTKNRLLALKEIESTGLPNDPPDLQVISDDAEVGCSILDSSAVRSCQSYQVNQDQMTKQDQRETSTDSSSKPTRSNINPSSKNGCVFEDADGQLDLISTQ